MSAPNVGSRFVSGRRNAAKEQIEAWMQTGEGIGVASRVSGQLPKNVTEAKMLHADLLEMSKQRYNFIKQNRWRQERFLDAQRKKTSVMKDLLKNVDINKVKMRTVSIDEQQEDAVMFRSPPQLVGATQQSVVQENRPISAKTTSTKASKLYAFVTERGTIYSSNQSVRSLPEVNLHRNSRADERWPVKDTRFTKLYKSLSDVYIPIKTSQSIS